jgi:hypothetical protein
MAASNGGSTGGVTDQRCLRLNRMEQPATQGRAVEQAISLPCRHSCRHLPGEACRTRFTFLTNVGWRADMAASKGGGTDQEAYPINGTR